MPSSPLEPAPPAPNHHTIHYLDDHQHRHQDIPVLWDLSLDLRCITPLVAPCPLPPPDPPGLPSLLGDGSAPPTTINCLVQRMSLSHRKYTPSPPAPIVTVTAFGDPGDTTTRVSSDRHDTRNTSADSSCTTTSTMICCTTSTSTSNNNMIYS